MEFMTVRELTYCFFVMLLVRSSKKFTALIYLYVAMVGHTLTK